MPSQYVDLLGPSYASRSYIAAHQRRLNLYQEAVPKETGEPLTFIQYARPGLTLLSTAPQFPIRGLYTASTGDLWACAGQGIYFVDTNWHWHLQQAIVPTTPANVVPRINPVTFADNGTQIIVADGTTRGWTFNAQTRVSNGLITDPNWQGATWVDFMDTFGLANQPNTPNFIVSVSEDLTNWNNGFAAMTGIATNCIAAVNVHRVLWLIGQLAFEVWQDTGGQGTISDQFPFQLIQAAFENVGCAAPYSITRTENEVLWVSQDRSGHGIVVMGTGTSIKRISTFAIENEIATYPNIADAIAYNYQMDGHTFVSFAFPSANPPYGKTWVYDLRTEQWSERAWLDSSGTEWRERINCATFAYGVNVAGDWQNGNLYKCDLSNYTDNGATVKYQVTSPHVLDTSTLNRVRHTNVRANFQTGSANVLIPQVVVDCSFHAADGTLIQNYFNQDDVGATWTRVGANNAQVLSDAMIALVASSPQYIASGIPTVADYVSACTIKPQLYNEAADPGSFIYMVNRADAISNGYIAGIFSDGAQYFLAGGITTMSYHELPLGLLEQDGTYRVVLETIGTGIKVAVQRTPDAFWLDPSSTWVPSPTVAIEFTDSTYSLPGHIIVGGVWV